MDQVIKKRLIVDVCATGGFLLLFLGFLSVTDSNVGHFVTVVLLALALVPKRVAPGIALSLAWLAAIIQLAFGIGPHLADAAILAVVYASAAYGSSVVRWLGLASVLLGSIVAAFATVLLVGSNTLDLLTVGRREFPFALGEIAFSLAVVLFLTLLSLGSSWLFGLVVRSRRLARESRMAAIVAEHERIRSQREVVIEQERNRIGRDMHDVVAHSLAVVIAQADGARYLRESDPDAIDDALLTIASTAREALGDVRLLLSQLRHSEGVAPQPALDDLDRLIQQLRSSGLIIVLEEYGHRQELAAGQQLAVYRIVQEALTNALRHGATDAEVMVTLWWAVNGVTIEARNLLLATQNLPSGDQHEGHGLPGMRERAILSGGWFRAEPRGGQFVVEAFVPGQAMEGGA